jgi:hypothetical protein
MVREYDDDEGQKDAIEYLSDEEADKIANEPDEYEEGREVGPDHKGVH